MTNQSQDILKELNFCVFDLETTGGNHQNDKIIEIGLVRIRGLKIVETKSFLINPEIHIPEFIQKLTSIKEKDVVDSPKIEECIDELVEFMGDDILVAHNISFDIPFFNSVLRRLDKPELINKSICTNLMTKYLIPNLLNSNLNYMCKIFGIKHQKAHRALDDAMATAHLIIKYLYIFIEKGITKINHLYYPRNRFELDRLNFGNETPIENILKIINESSSSLLITLKGENGTILQSLPISNKTLDSDIKMISRFLTDEKWESITIRIFAHFFESVLNFNGFFNKLEPAKRQKINRYLWKNHVNTDGPTKFENEHEVDNFLSLTADLVILPHIVPEQYIVYPLGQLNPHTRLIFRYPAHQKKLIQYVQSKASKVGKKKIKKNLLNPMLKHFLSFYLKEKQEQVALVKNNIIINHKEDFLKILDDFTSKNHNASNYPQKHI